MRRITRAPDGATARLAFSGCAHLDLSHSTHPDTRLVVLANEPAPCRQVLRQRRPPVASEWVQACELTGQLLCAPRACTAAVYALCPRFQQADLEVTVDAECVDVGALDARPGRQP